MLSFSPKMSKTPPPASEVEATPPSLPKDDEAKEEVKPSTPGDNKDWGGAADLQEKKLVEKVHNATHEIFNKICQEMKWASFTFTTSAYFCSFSTYILLSFSRSFLAYLFETN